LKELDDGWAVIKPGAPEKSELVRRIFTDDEDDLMPPSDSHLALAPSEKDLLRRWIIEGAEFKPHWAFIPIHNVRPPSVANMDWVQNPIDQFILARLEAEQLFPAPQAPREMLIRRLAFDLTGLPPRIAEMDAFLADESPDAYEKMVSYYLNSPAYGERMALDWLDLARYADTYGYQNDVERDMSPWRDWVIKAFNEDLPYDRFLAWQLAGDLLPDPTREQRIATAFNRLHRQTNEGGSIDEEFRTEYAIDRVNTMSTAMLGLTMECARCHDHKFDPISQREYYSLFAFFNNIDESGMYSHFTMATPSPAMLLWPEDKEREYSNLTNKIAAAEANLAVIKSRAPAQFQAWAAADGLVCLPRPIASFPFDEVTNSTTSEIVSGTNVARLVDEPVLITGHDGRALQFSGDNYATCKTVPNFKRIDEFSIALWLKPTERQDRAVILHQSKAWADAGSRGFELILDHGKPYFGLIHFWPGNAIAIRANTELPTNEWSHIAITYDGSSHASGMQIYLDGRPVEAEVVGDRLYKDIIHRAEWGDKEVGRVYLQLAARFRDSGFKNGLIDDLQVYNTRLTPAEIATLLNSNADPDSSGTFEYFLARKFQPYRDAIAELQNLREQENDLINDIPEIMIMEEMPTPRVAHRLNRGAYDAPAEIVERDTPAAILPFASALPRNRLGLAEWVTDPNNPLTARVVVNRIWRMHFGRGIVASQEDFGSQGKLPTHPELLDWLAGWFMNNGWDVKALHKLIVSSATFQQSSRTRPEVVERDPENHLLARYPKARLSAEEIRDSALAASGLLDREIGGPSVKPYQPEGLWESTGTGKSYVQDHGDKLYRRSLYTFWKRTAPPPSMLTFDAMSREVCTARRESTATPLQSLVLLNDPQFVEASRVLGEKLLKQFPNDEAARNREAFRTLTGRGPDKIEAKILTQLYAEQKAEFVKNPGDAKKLLNVGESKSEDGLAPADSAAMTTLVNAIMNFDEFIVER